MTNSLIGPIFFVCIQGRGKVTYPLFEKYPCGKILGQSLVLPREYQNRLSRKKVSFWFSNGHRVETDLMCVLCSEFSCRVGNNHQIQRREKKEEDELLAQQTFPFFLLFLGASSLLYSAGYWCHQWTRWRLLGVRPNS